MRILVVDCFSSTAKGRRDYEAFYQLTEAAVRESIDDAVIWTRKMDEIDDFVYLPREVYGLDESTKRAALAVFQEMDGDGSGGVDQREMYQLVQVLFQRLGVQLAKEHIAMLRDEVAQVFTLYDYDKSGTLEFDEFCQLLCRDPWREMLPANARQKESAIKALRNFTLIDMIIVDGDPNILPWEASVLNLLVLLHQVYIAQLFPGGTANVALLGSALVTNMLVYLQSVGRELISPFNGNRHLGTRLM